MKIQIEEPKEEIYVGTLYTDLDEQVLAVILHTDGNYRLFGLNDLYVYTSAANLNDLKVSIDAYRENNMNEIRGFKQLPKGTKVTIIV